MILFACVIAAMVLDAVLGEPDWLWSRLPHPAVLMGRALAWCDRRLNAAPGQKIKGVISTTGLACFAAGIGWGLSHGGPWVVVPVAAILLAQKSLVQHVAAVAGGLRTSLAEGRRMVARIVSRDTAQMDQNQIARAAIESAAENLSDGVIAPVFWCLVGGLPGLMVYKIVNTGDSMIGYRTPRHEAFGWATARLDDLLNLIPARLTAVLIVAVSGGGDLRAIRSEARLHRSPNAGWPEAALSRALGVALAGPRAYEGRMQDFAWVNASGRRDLSPDDIDAACVLLWKSWGAALAVIATITVLSWGLSS